MEEENGLIFHLEELTVSSLPQHSTRYSASGGPLPDSPFSPYSAYGDGPTYCCCHFLVMATLGSA